MSKAEAKKMAEKFIEEQKRILEQYGDGVVKSKCKEAVMSVQAVFQQIAAKPSSNEKNGTHAKS